MPHARTARPSFSGLALSALILLTGCASSSLEVAVSTRAETYRTIDAPLEMLGAAPARCAALPAIATGGEAARASFVDLAVERAIAKGWHPFTLVGPVEESDFTILAPGTVRNRCIAGGRVAELRRLLSSSDPGGILDSGSLRDLGRFLGVEYILAPRLCHVTIDNANRFSLSGISFLRTGWTTVEAELRLWHAPSGELAWQSVGSVSLNAESVIGISPPLQGALNAVFLTLLGDLASGRSETRASGTIDAQQEMAPIDQGISTELPKDAESETATVGAPKAAPEVVGSE